MVESGEETKADEEDADKEGYRDGDTPRGALVEVIHTGGTCPPPRGKCIPPGLHT